MRPSDGCPQTPYKWSGLTLRPRDQTKLSIAKTNLPTPSHWPCGKDVLGALSVLSGNRYSSRWQAFPVHLGSELLSIPSRIYYDPPVLQAMRLTNLESEILGLLAHKAS